MRESSIENSGIQIGGRRITNLRYADDTVLLAENADILQDMISKVSKICGLSLNVKENESYGDKKDSQESVK